MTVERSAKQKLAKLMSEAQPIIDANIKDMTSAEIDFILTNYKKYLKIDLERDLEKARETGLKNSPFDEILNDGFKL